jgi:hypothetical protein
VGGADLWQLSGVGREDETSTRYCGDIGEALDRESCCRCRGCWRESSVCLNDEGGVMGGESYRWPPEVLSMPSISDSMVTMVELSVGSEYL